MERLEAKKIKGRTYYYYSKWAWIDGKCRRVRQKYLGTLEKIAKMADAEDSAPLYAEVFQWGLPVALWKECLSAGIITKTNQLCPKRDQGLSTGEYLAIAAINRAICPSSKRSMWEWFSQTALVRYLPSASKSCLTSQRFWDHMAKISKKPSKVLWANILKATITREDVDLSSVSYDGTNFYTFIDTFNYRCQIAKRGKNKQGRNNLRQVGYALFCSADGHIPLYYDIYDGNRNDAKQFPVMLESFHRFLKDVTDGRCHTPKTTLIFDKGNNSVGNFSFLDSMQVGFVGSVKLDEHKELIQMPNDDPKFVPCTSFRLEGTKAYRINKKVYGKERVFVVTYNQNLFNCQWLTLQNDIAKATEKLSALQQKLEDRINGLITKGKAPTKESVKKQCGTILSRQHMKKIITIKVERAEENLTRLKYGIDSNAIANLSNTYLGKNIIITNQKEWDNDKIITSYRSQFIIEDVFKEMKDRQTGSWWPMHHWTDSKINVHALYCTIALLIRALMFRRLNQAGLSLSMKRVLTELGSIREVVNIFPKKGKQKKERKQSILTKFSETQHQIMSVLSLEAFENDKLG